MKGNKVSAGKHTAKGRGWFSKRRLGLFIHWGLYSVPAWHEQLQWRKKIPRAEYGTLIRKFNPKAFNPSGWLDLAEEAGMEYIVFTAKHHDGFCMWDTRQTDFNVMNSPCKRDVLGMLSEECRKRRFPLGIYYSVVDWRHPNYPNMGRSHELPRPERGDKPDLAQYLEYLKAQVTELCTGYGRIREFWWDMNRTEHTDPSINNLIRSLRPGVVINDRGFDAGDFGTPERESQKTSGVSAFENQVEACNSVGSQSWGYKADEDYYSLRHLIRSIDSVMARGGNYLLNVGPKADGSLPAPAVKTVKAVGRWYKKVKESFSAPPVPGLLESGFKVYRGFPPELSANPGILAGKKGSILYLHLNSFPRSEGLVMKPVVEAPKKAVLLNTGRELECGLDFLPSLWAFERKFPRVRKIPVNRLSNEVPVLKVIF